MAYLVKYFKNFNDKETIREICRKDAALGYKIKVFAGQECSCTIEEENTEFIFCSSPQQQAVQAAKQLFAEKVQFYVKRAVYSVDPAQYPFAVKIKEMDYEAAQELSVNGYNEIGYDIINTAKRASVRMEILSLYDPEPTTVKEVAVMSENVIKTISKDPDIAIITLTELPDKPGATFRVFNLVSEEDIYVDSIMLPAANGNSQDISFCVKMQDVQRAKELLFSHRQQLEFSDIIINTDAAKISVMGSGFHTQKGVAAKILEVFYLNNINIMTIFTSEVKVSLVVKRSQADEAIRAIHKKLIVQ